MPFRFNLIGRNQASCQVFLDICPDFTADTDLSASAFIHKYWTIYQGHAQRSNSMNGQIFELIISTMLINKEIMPFFIQSNVAFVPNVRYDVLLNSSEEGLIGLSLKTSLRERYKQADLEAYALKNVHRRSKSFIITASSHEAINVNRKIEHGELLALNKVYHYQDIDELIEKLAQLTFIIPSPVEIVTGKSIHNRTP